MKSNLKSNLAFSVLGVVFNTLFPLITFPYITRILGVANLGEYNFYASTVAYLALVSGFGISLYGTKEIGKNSNDTSKYSQIFAELLTINFIMVVIVYLLVISLMCFSNNYHNTKLFLITSITILTECIGAEFLFVALEKQKFMLVRNVIFKIISLGLLIIFVRNENDLLSYAVIMLLSTAGISITNILAYKKLINWNDLKIRPANLLIHLTPLIQVFFMNLLINYFGKMDLIILGNLSGIESVGYYSTASKIYALAYSFLASTAIPLLPRASFYLEKGLIDDYNALMQKCYDIYVIFLLFISFALFYYSEEIITLLAGADFILSSIPLKYFSVSLLFSSLCNCFIFQIFYPHNRSNQVLLAIILSIVVNIILSIVLIPSFSYIGAAFAFLMSYIVMFVTMLVLGRGCIPKFSGMNDLLKEIISILICLFVAHVLNMTNIYFIFSLILCGIVYIISCFMLRNKTIYYLFSIIFQKLKK